MRLSYFPAPRENMLTGKIRKDLFPSELMGKVVVGPPARPEKTPPNGKSIFRREIP